MALQSRFPIKARLFSLLFLGVCPLLALGQDLEGRKAIAQSQHERIVLLIQKGDFDRVGDEFQKILDLHFTGKYEKSVVDEVQILSELLGQKGRNDVAQALADKGLAQLRERDSQARLYKEKGFIYKRMGQGEKAMEMFEKGRSIEEGK